MKILKKNGMDAFCFRVNVFLTKCKLLNKIWVKSIYFSVQNRKKWLCYWFFCCVILTELTFFGPNMGMTAGVFSFKIWKKITWEQCVFEKMDNFPTKYGHESRVFFREWAFFWQKVGMRAVIFWWKISKKGILFTFVSHNIV